MIIIVTGDPGSGKTSFVTSLPDQERRMIAFLDSKFFDPDSLIQLLHSYPNQCWVVEIADYEFVAYLSQSLECHIVEAGDQEEILNLIRSHNEKNA